MQLKKSKILKAHDGKTYVVISAAIPRINSEKLCCLYFYWDGKECFYSSKDNGKGLVSIGILFALTREAIENKLCPENLIT